MGRTAHSDYVEAAREVLDELGGGPISSRDLVAAAQERGLVGNGTWVYHNFLRKIREDEKFDTSKRGYVALSNGVVSEEGPGVGPIAEAEVVTPDLTSEAVVNEAPEAEGNPFVKNVE